jgi:hypothetical protein
LLIYFSHCSIDGIDPAEFECLYSPAKRRGPVPGRETFVWSYLSKQESRSDNPRKRQKLDVERERIVNDNKRTEQKPDVERERIATDNKVYGDGAKAA